MGIKITTLIENNTDENNLLSSEHGLSLYVEINGINILFDTGQSGEFIKNAEKLNINLNTLDYVIISHGHYDHSGGFRKLAQEKNKSFKFIVGNVFFNEKYKLLEEGKYKFNGNSFSKTLINENNIDIKYVTKDSFSINKEILIFSNFGKNNEFEILNKKFYIKNDEEYISDDFSDEIALVLKHEKGLIVILGCSHVGVVNILETIIKRTGMNIYCVIGGSHLIEADELRIDKTIKFLKENNISMLRLSHCTGDNAVGELECAFGEKFMYNNTGNIIEIK